MTGTREVAWRQLTLGHLSRNKFWGEDPDTQYHSVVASSTLLRDGDINILVDPTLPAGEMERRLRLYCGLGLEDIDIVFATHFHTDHRVDAEKYPRAKLYMSAESVQDVASLRKQGGPFADAFLNGAVYDFMPAPRQLSPGVTVCPLAGHTLGLAGLVFSSGGKRVLLAGDTIMNREFYHAREGYFIDASQQKTAASMNWAAEHADIIVPGHGDWFFANETNESTLKYRKLNLCADGEETAVLVQAGSENILINPALKGPLLRQALYDARGLDPADITRVICLKNDPQHMLDLPVMKNAQAYLPEFEAARQGDPSFPVWEKVPGIPIEIIEIESCAVCLFESGGHRVSVASGCCSEQRLADLGVQVSFQGGRVSILG